MHINGCSDLIGICLFHLCLLQELPEVGEVGRVEGEVGRVVGEGWAEPEISPRRLLSLITEYKAEVRREMRNIEAQISNIETLMTGI